MADLDLNLLEALAALLREGSVTGAARRLGLSVSATSRALARLRIATGDPLLVQAGRRMAPTPKAEELRVRADALLSEARALLAPAQSRLDLGALDRTFAIRANEGFLELFAPAIAVAVADEAPFVRLRFAAKPEKDPEPLRNGDVDLEIGVVGGFAPEVRSTTLFRDRFVGAARRGHPLLEGAMTAERYASCRHVVASRRGSFLGPVDDALSALGLSRRTSVVVPGFADALRVARASDLVALVPASTFAARERTEGVVGFDLPVATPTIAVSLLWHPRMDADAAHRWLRGTIASICRAAADDLVASIAP